MLKIRPAQLEILSSSTRECLYRDVADWMCKTFPARYGWLSSDDLKNCVQHQVGYAASFGFDSTRPILLFLECINRLGLGFPYGPGQEPCANILNHPDAAPAEKLRALEQVLFPEARV